MRRGGEDAASRPLAHRFGESDHISAARESGKDAPAMEREDKVKENLTIESAGAGVSGFGRPAEIAQNRCYGRDSTASSWDHDENERPVQWLTPKTTCSMRES